MRHADSSHLPSPVPQGIIDKVVEYFLQERIGKYFQIRISGINADIPQGKPGDDAADYQVYILPYGGIHP